FLGGVPTPLPRTYTLAPGQTIELSDILATEFNLEIPAVAGLRIHPLAPAALIASSRTSVPKFSGFYGYTIDGIFASRAIGLGSQTRTTIFLDQASGTGGTHSSFGFAEVGGAPTAVQVTAVDGPTGTTIASKSYLVAANSEFQIDLSDLIGSANAANVYLQF